MPSLLKPPHDVRALLLKSVAKAGTITHLAESLGINAKTISRWLKGTAFPTNASICKLEYFVAFGPLQEPLFQDFEEGDGQ